MRELVCLFRAAIRPAAMSLKHRGKRWRTDIIRRDIVDGDITKPTSMVFFVFAISEGCMCMVFVCIVANISMTWVRIEHLTKCTRHHVTICTWRETQHGADDD